jgi:pyruvate-formate lyase-activating enzyme
MTYEEQKTQGWPYCNYFNLDVKEVHKVHREVLEFRVIRRSAPVLKECARMLLESGLIFFVYFVVHTKVQPPQKISAEMHI